MHKSLLSLKPEQLLGLAFVLAIHGGALYALWSYRIIPTPDEAITLMVNLIKAAPPEQPKPPKPAVHKLPPPEPLPPEHPHLVAETPVVSPEEPVAYSPPPPPVIEAPPQPMALIGELSAACPDRYPPEYPAFSKRLNEQGKVILRVVLGEDGLVAGIEVQTSSGYPRLDEAALSAVKTWRCKPSVRNGIAVRAVALQPLNFILQGR
jgi:protein TonB